MFTKYRLFKTLALFMLLLFAASLASAVCAQTKFSGNYNLNLYGVSRWKTDYILVRKLDSKTVDGIIGLDWNILQEARLPANYEKMHEIPFKGTVSENGKCIKFKLQVAGMKEYSFTLFLMEFEAKPALTGFVEIKSLKNAAPIIKTGVLAVMK